MAGSNPLCAVATSATISAIDPAPLAAGAGNGLDLGSWLAASPAAPANSSAFAASSAAPAISPSTGAFSFDFLFMAKPKNYIEDAKRLRAFGLGGNFDLRRKLTPQQKGAITRQIQKFSTIVNYPDNFAVTQVKNKTAEKITIAAKKIPGKNGKTKLIIPIEKGQTVSVKRGNVVFKGGGYNEEVFPGGWDFFKNAEKAFSKKLKKNEYITMRVGDNRPFSRIFKNMGELLNYAQGWNPDDWRKLGASKTDMKKRRELKNDLINHVSITRIDFGKKKRK
jgi:hypothetical protein